MPVYNGAAVISPTIKSILSQSYSNFELIIVNDHSTDNSEKVVKRFRDKRIKYYENKKNLGYSRNIEECRRKAKGDIIYLMGQDDILGENALLTTYSAFASSGDIGAVTRPYFWFDKEINLPVRAKKQLNSEKDEVIALNSDPRTIVKVFDTLDQLSGLAYRRKYMDLPFHEDVFPCHIYPFASIFKKHPVVFLKDYNIAVRISTSQTRKLSSIYCKSPMRSWKEMLDNVFYEKKWQKTKKYLLNNFVAVNFIGLVQLRNYAQFWHFAREIYYLVKYRPLNLFNFSFWFFSLGCLVMPPPLLIPLVDWYKSHINSYRLRRIKFRYSLKTA